MKQRETRMNTDDMVLWLALATLGVAVAIGLWQVRRVRRAKARHSHSALTEGRPDQRRHDGAPGVPPQR
jgi:cytochrome oxidase assembly protein ShyY1